MVVIKRINRTNDYLFKRIFGSEEGAETTAGTGINIGGVTGPGAGPQIPAG
ncbi:Rpn family recombination-promoting nuclease/putative transposase [Desulfallas thermosapovorans]|uniref:Uncharacterized protein n=1 Tax=Desulfallas thermosapovorans DSM 6562 TaxID=1121431 RepID=A0A5S4ZS77_9FIRM|nr:Rpn family recombination-promoting nuclease/putative transposase [Desulfallas thermosapovorans]TYO95512.1 hypothetical protein LX24_01473 [Desulfallas thermosapovorans DSM 6562]